MRPGQYRRKRALGSASAAARTAMASRPLGVGRWRHKCILIKTRQNYQCFDFSFRMYRFLNGLERASGTIGSGFLASSSD